MRRLESQLQTQSEQYNVQLKSEIENLHSKYEEIFQQDERKRVEGQTKTAENSLLKDEIKRLETDLRYNPTQNTLHSEQQISSDTLPLKILLIHLHLPTQTLKEL